MRPLLRAAGIVRDFLGKDGTVLRVLGGIDLCIPGGESSCHAIVGPNAVGKTTLARVLAGLDDCTEGTLETCPEKDRLFSSIALQDVDGSLLQHRSNLFNMTLGLEARGVEPRPAANRVRSLIEEYGLPVPLNKYPGRSSGGERQMTSLVRAAVVEPSLLILDEPLSKIDPTQVWRWRHFVRQYSQERGVSCLLITHSIDDAVMIADSVHVVWRYSTEGARIAKTIEVEGPRVRGREWFATDACQQIRRQVQESIDAAYLD